MYVYIYIYMHISHSIHICTPAAFQERRFANIKEWTRLDPELLLIMQSDQVSHEKVMTSIELFGKEVIPAFK